MARLTDDLRDLSRVSRGQIELQKERVDLKEILASAVETSLPLVETANHELMLHTVFNMFTPVGHDPDGTPGGLGTGPTPVRSLTELHGGTVAAESGRTGSTFTVRLPLAAESAHAGHGSGDTPSSGPARLRVLVVDDNADSVSMLSMLIDLKGHTTATAQSGQEALEVAAEFRPDVVILDIGLPGMDGYQVASALRQRPDSAQTLLVALTGWGSAEDKQRTRDAGFDHHFTKPVDPQALEQLLATTTPRGAR